MKKKINPDIIKKTTECFFEFQCLKENGKPHCEIVSTNFGYVFFVKYSSSLNCGYALSVGDDHMCLCPTRGELYLKYKI